MLKKGLDRKWDELSKLLQSDAKELFFPDGRRRKMIIFTEHKDTLYDLVKKIARVLSDPDAIVEMHGGKRREERLEAQERFRQDKKVCILVATDAAGEGVNLQVANLMVNYDLPWNPNRLEQRFGRIHRIGQTEICRLWNLVAFETREGEVYERLFLKLEEERKALGGKVFDILGESFEDTSLRDLLIEAIRYGNQPEVQARLFEKVEGALDHKHLQQIIDRNALTADKFSQEHLFRVKDAMEKAEAKKLQPFYLRRFVTDALRRYGGELREREPARYEIKHVPAVIRAKHAIGRRAAARPGALRAGHVRSRAHADLAQAGGRPRSPSPPADVGPHRHRAQRGRRGAPRRHRARRSPRHGDDAAHPVHDRPRDPRRLEHDPPCLPPDGVRRDRRRRATRGTGGPRPT